MTFNDQSAISSHYDTAHAQSGGRPERPDARYECEICGRKFTEKSNLKSHLRNIHGLGDAKTFQCDLCPKVCALKTNLKQHMADVHNIDVENFKCDICSKEFKHKSALKKHLTRVH